MVGTEDIWGWLGPLFIAKDVGILVDIWYDLSWPAMVENVLVTFDDSPVSGNTHGRDFQSNVFDKFSGK